MFNDLFIIKEKQSNCNLCKYANEHFSEAKIIINNPNNNKFIYFIFEWAFNYDTFIKHYINQLKDYNIIIINAINCFIHDIPKIKEINTCKYILEAYLKQYTPSSIIAFGTIALQSLNRIKKINEYDEKNIDLENIYYFNNTVPIYTTYSPLMYIRSKNQDILLHIHSKIEEATEKQLDIYKYYNKNIIETELKNIKEYDAQDLTDEIDLNNYDVVLEFSNKENTIFALYHPEKERKYIILDKVTIADKLHITEKKLTKLNFASFKKVDKYYKYDKKLTYSLNKLSENIGYPLNVNAFYANGLVLYSYITTYAKNRQFHKIPYLVCDIEVLTDENNTFPDPNTANGKIICLTIYQDNKYYTYYTATNKKINNTNYIKFDTEKELLEHVWKHHISKAFILYGWNAYFDFIYLYNRAIKLGINILSDIYYLPDNIDVYFKFANSFTERNIASCPMFDIHDLMDIYKTNVSDKLPSYALNYIGKIELNKEKIKLEDTMYNLWNSDPEKIIYYNTVDTEITVEILNKYRLYDFFDSIRQIINMPFNYKYFTPTVYGKLIMYNELFKNKIIASYIPNNKSSFNIQYTGAFVQTPVPYLITTKK